MEVFTSIAWPQQERASRPRLTVSWRFWLWFAHPSKCKTNCLGQLSSPWQTMGFEALLAVIAEFLKSSLIWVNWARTKNDIPSNLWLLICHFSFNLHLLVRRHFQHFPAVNNQPGRAWHGRFSACGDGFTPPFGVVRAQHIGGHRVFPIACHLGRRLPGWMFTRWLTQKLLWDTALRGYFRILVVTIWINFNDLHPWSLTARP